MHVLQSARDLACNQGRLSVWELCAYLDVSLKIAMPDVLHCQEQALAVLVPVEQLDKEFVMLNKSMPSFGQQAFTSEYDDGLSRPTGCYLPQALFSWRM